MKSIEDGGLLVPMQIITSLEYFTDFFVVSFLGFVERSFAPAIFLMEFKLAGILEESNDIGLSIGRCDVPHVASIDRMELIPIGESRLQKDVKDLLIVFLYRFHEERCQRALRSFYLAACSNEFHDDFSVSRQSIQYPKTN